MSPVKSSTEKEEAAACRSGRVGEIAEGMPVGGKDGKKRMLDLGL